jgi:hypothetical protein
MGLVHIPNKASDFRNNSFHPLTPHWSPEKEIWGNKPVTLDRV